jgi:CubicO group peptidase (beta-lactamase class C family)
MTRSSTISPHAPPPPRPRTRGAVVVVVVCAALALAVGLVARPVPTRLPDHHVGDAALATLAREVVGEEQPALAVAAVTRDGTRTVAIGAGLDDRFEIGSISKGLTGLLFADMIGRGEVTADTRLGDLVPVDGPVADVTLAQLATHHSGLPRQPTTAAQFVRAFWSGLSAGDPHIATLDQLLAELADVDLDTPAATYSNVGFELLGAALAAAGGAPYPQLLAERVLTPLGMDDTIVPVSAAELGPRDLLGEAQGGRRADPWLGEAMGPAGAGRADITDMAVLARALLDGSAPGIDALTPRSAFDDEDSIGWAWFTRAVPATGTSVVWHNGGTGGFTSFLGIDRDAGTAVVVLSAAGEPPNRITTTGFTLLERIGGEA